MENDIALADAALEAMPPFEATPPFDILVGKGTAAQPRRTDFERTRTHHAVDVELPDRPCVRHLLTYVEPAATDDSCEDLVGRFLADDELYALPVVDADEVPQGLVDRYRFVEFFTRRYVVELHGKKSIGQFLRSQPSGLRHHPPVMVDEVASIDDVAQIIIDAGMQHMVSGVIVTQGGRYAGIANGHDLLQEITRRRQSELYYLAHYDQLTLLPNRMLFNDRLKQACREAARNKTSVGVLFVDLDRFKQINDSMGHGFGDALLRAVAERMQGCVRDCDTVGRLGGDEFAVLVDVSKDGSDVSELARRLVEAMKDPFQILGREVFITASVGLAVYPRDDTDVTRLFAKADAAMYEAKANGRNGFREYAPGLSMYNLDRISLETDLRAALENQEFVIHYQPQICLASQRMVGVEALIRWRHPKRGLLSPIYFIEAAEENGMIADIGKWVLREACAQSRAWAEQGRPRLRMAINISALQFRQTDFPDTVRQVLAETGADAETIELELTESIVMHNVTSVVCTLDELKRLGVHLAIDDFGTGFSSLSYLSRFPVDRLKIDRSFVRGIDRLPANETIVRAITSLAHNLGMGVVAEGTETAEELAILRTCQCDEAQGYWFAKPMAANDFQRWWEQRERPSA